MLRRQRRNHLRNGTSSLSISSSCTILNNNSSTGLQNFDTLESLLEGSSPDDHYPVQICRIAKDNYKNVVYKHLLLFLFKNKHSDNIEMIGLRLMEPLRDHTISVSKWQKYKPITDRAFTGNCWSRVVHYYRNNSTHSALSSSLTSALKSQASKFLVTEHQYLHLVDDHQCRFLSTVSDKSQLEFDIVHQITAHEVGNSSCSIQCSFYLDTHSSPHNQTRIENSHNIARSILIMFHNQFQINLNLWIAKRHHAHNTGILSGSRDMLSGRAFSSHNDAIVTTTISAFIPSAKSEPNLSSTIFKALSNRTNSHAQIKEIQQPPVIPKRISTAHIKTRYESSINTPVASTSASPKPSSVELETESTPPSDNEQEYAVFKDDRPRERPYHTPPPSESLDTLSTQSQIPLKYASKKANSSSSPSSPKSFKSLSSTIRAKRKRKLNRVPGGLEASMGGSPSTLKPTCFYLLIYFSHFCIVILLVISNLRIN